MKSLRKKSIKLFKKCFLILYIALIISFIISCIKQSNRDIWESISAMLILMVIDTITSLHIKHQIKKQHNFPTNFNYKILPINIFKTDRKKIGALYSPISYIYINLNHKTITFPESKYGMERKYILMGINDIHAGNVLDLKHARKRTKIRVHKMTEKQIKLLEEILYHSNHHQNSHTNTNESLFLKIIKNHI